MPILTGPSTTPTDSNRLLRQRKALFERTPQVENLEGSTCKRLSEAEPQNSLFLSKFHVPFFNLPRMQSSTSLHQMQGICTNPPDFLGERGTIPCLSPGMFQQNGFSLQGNSPANGFARFPGSYHFCFQKAAFFVSEGDQMQCNAFILNVSI